MKKLKRFVRTKLIPYKPFVRKVNEWDSEYKSGKWDYLYDKPEQARYNLLISYITHFFGNNASILDLGCGIGILRKKLNNNYSHYCGVDISNEAIKVAQEFTDSKTEFHTADILDFVPSMKYDCILFNESIYYFDKPLDLIKKYIPYLTDEGMIIISMWDNEERNNKLWDTFDSLLHKVDGIYLRHDSGSAWNIRVYKPLK